MVKILDFNNMTNEKYKDYFSVYFSEKLSEEGKITSHGELLSLDEIFNLLDNFKKNDKIDMICIYRRS